MPELTKLQAVLRCKCPRCREGDMFTYPLRKIKYFDQMYEHCPSCGLRYQVEPGFFFGAMYISYGFSVATLVACALALYFLFDDPALWVYILSVPLVIIIGLPLYFRLSRSIFLHVFGGVNYNAHAND